MAKGKYSSSKFSGATTELMNNYYENTNNVMKRKIANNATSQPKQQKAVLSKPQQKNNDALKQTASFLNNKQNYQQEFPSLGQSYKAQSAPKPQQQKPQQMKQKPQQQKMVNRPVVAPKTTKSTVTYTAQQIEQILKEFYILCQCYDGINYFGMAAYQKNCWSKSQGQWVNTAIALALNNAPAVRRSSKQPVKKQSIQQPVKRQSVQQAPVKRQSVQQPAKRMSKQAEGSFLTQFNEIAQCYDGMNYFGNSSFQANCWSSKKGQWVNTACAIAIKNAPAVRRTSNSKQPVKKQSIQQPIKKQSIQQAPVKRQSVQQPAKRMSKQAEGSFLTQFNEIAQCFDGMNYFGNSSFQTNCWSNNKGQWFNTACTIAIKNAPAVRRTSNSKQPVKKQSIQQPVKRQSIQQQQRQPVKRQSVQKQPVYNFTNECSEVAQCYDGMNYFGNSSFQANCWSKNRQGQWVNSACTMALKNAPVVGRQSKTTAKKQPVQQKAAPVRQPPVKKQPVQQKAPVRQAPVKKQPVQQQKRMMKRNVKPVDNSARIMEQQQMNQKCIVAQQNASMRIQNQIIKQFNEKKMIEEQQQQLKQQQKKVQQKKPQSVKQNVKQPANLKKVNSAPKRQVIPAGMTRSQFKKAQKKQQLVNKINKRIQELVAEKHQRQLFSQMVKHMTQHILEEKQKARIEKSKVQAQVKKQAPVKQAPAKQAPVKKAPVKQAPIKQAPVKQAPVRKTSNTRKLSATQTKMLNIEFTELCNAFDCTTYQTYSNYTTWNKSVSSASVISARNAPRITNVQRKVSNSRKPSGPKMNKRK